VPGNLIDDRLFAPHQGPVIQGSYRGRRKRIFVPRVSTAAVTRTVESKNGWHRAVVKLGEHEYYRSPALRDRDQAWEIARTIWVEGHG
jgi:hypothetical protein